MIKNNIGRLEMFPIPIPKECIILIVGESVSFEEIRDSIFYDFIEEESLRKNIDLTNININDISYTVAIPYILNKIKSIDNDTWTKQNNRLWETIKECKAKIVIPLGLLATKLLLNEKQGSMKKFLGNIIELNEVTIIPNMHPSSLYLHPGDYKLFTQVWDNIALTYRKLKFNPGSTIVNVVDSESKLLELIELIKEVPYVAADIETNSLTTWKADIWVIGIALAKNKVYVIDRKTMLENIHLINIMFSLNTKWIWHNGKYDCSVLFYNQIHNSRVDEDTLLLHYCLNESTGTHSLGQLSTLFLGADEYKSEMNSEFANILTEDSYNIYRDRLINRVAIDCDYTLQLYEIFKKLVVSNSDLDRLYNNILIPGSNFLKRIEINGMKVNEKYLKSNIPKYELKEKELEKEIMDYVYPYWNEEKYSTKVKSKSNLEFNPNSTKKLSYLIWDILGLRPSIKCKIGATGKDILESIPNAPPIISKILELRKVKKEHAAFCDSYLKSLDDDNIIHTSFSLHSTVTGRLSSSSPNIQQIPSKKKDVRRAFIPRHRNRILMEVDYSGAELRVLAWISADEKLAKAVTEGDLHSEVAESIFGSDFTKEQRGMAKTVNFGIIYGRGANDLSNAFPQYSVDECQRWIDTWGKTYPKAWEYLESCVEDLKSGLPLTTPFGRYRRFGLISKQAIKDLSNESKNFRIQSISSDNTFIAAMELENLIKPYGAFIINLIHDSILFDCPSEPEKVQALAMLITNHMENIPKRYYNCDVKFHCDVDLGYNWGDLYSYSTSTQKLETKEWSKDYSEWRLSNGNN